MYNSLERSWTGDRIYWTGFTYIAYALFVLGALVIFPNVGKTVMMLFGLLAMSIIIRCDILPWWKNIPRPMFPKIPKSKKEQVVENKEPIDWVRGLKSIALVIGICLYLYTFYSLLGKGVLWAIASIRSFVG